MYKERMVPTFGFDEVKVAKDIAMYGSTDYLVKVDLIGYFPWVKETIELPEGCNNLDEFIDKFGSEDSFRGKLARRLLLQEDIRENYLAFDSFTIAIEVSRTTHPRKEAERLYRLILN
ncbi:MAG: hypothetical protein DRO98_01620 [Archaeoglobales archaeon]|nr:MAG: hypothetical protein DRO98_01620 [Archaeoglobales archaeon]